MTDADRLRSLEERVRQLELVDTPRQRELVQELHDIRRRMQDLETHGTTMSAHRLTDLEADVNKLAQLVDDDKKDRRRDRQAILVALIAAAAAVAAAVIGAVAGR